MDEKNDRRKQNNPHTTVRGAGADAARRCIHAHTHIQLCAIRGCAASRPRSK